VTGDEKLQREVTHFPQPLFGGKNPYAVLFSRKVVEREIRQRLYTDFQDCFVDPELRRMVRKDFLRRRTVRYDTKEEKEAGNDFLSDAGFHLQAESSKMFGYKLGGAGLAVT
jgi:hypothetical protein